MPYKVSKNGGNKPWVMVQRNGRWVKLKRHSDLAEAQRHATALNIALAKRKGR